MLVVNGTVFFFCCSMAGLSIILVIMATSGNDMLEGQSGVIYGLIFYVISLINSSINPIIYNVTIKTYRKAFYLAFTSQKELTQTWWFCLGFKIVQLKARVSLMFATDVKNLRVPHFWASLSHPVDFNGVKRDLGKMIDACRLCTLSQIWIGIRTFVSLDFGIHDIGVKKYRVPKIERPSMDNRIKSLRVLASIEPCIKWCCMHQCFLWRSCFTPLLSMESGISVMGLI